MKYYLFFTSFIYWCLMIFFGFAAAVSVVNMVIGNTPMAHGDIPDTPNIDFYIKGLIKSLLALSMAIICFKAGKQSLYPIIVVNLALIAFLVFISAAVYWYFLLALTISPVAMILWQIFAKKSASTSS